MEPNPIATTGGVLVLVGSCAPQARTQAERLAEAGALVLTLSRETVLQQDESILMGIRSAAAAAIKQGRTVLVRSENWPEAREVTRRLAARRGISASEIEARVGTLLGRVAQGALRALDTLRLVVVGTDTCQAVCRQVGVQAPPVGAGPAPVSEQLVLHCLAGGAPEPDALIRAVGGLAAR